MSKSEKGFFWPIEKALIGLIALGFASACITYNFLNTENYQIIAGAMVVETSTSLLSILALAARISLVNRPFENPHAKS